MHILEIIEKLKQAYPEPLCALKYGKDYELLFAARLSAQCTDVRVNQVTPVLFGKYPSLDAFANAEITEIEEIIRSCGFYHAKARDIVNAAKMLINDFAGKLPCAMEQLLRLPGVGRKTANLLLGEVFGLPSIVVDTHCIRLTNRLGLVKTKKPEEIEIQLRGMLPAEESSDFCHRLVLHGRTICTARKPKCGICVLSEECIQCI